MPFILKLVDLFSGKKNPGLGTLVLILVSWVGFNQYNESQQLSAIETRMERIETALEIKLGVPARPVTQARNHNQQD